MSNMFTKLKRRIDLELYMIGIWWRYTIKKGG